MKNKNKLAIVSILSFGLIFSACNKDEAKDNKSTNDSTQKVEETKNTPAATSAATSDTEKKDDASNNNEENVTKDGENNKDAKSSVSLSDWQGDWNSMYEYLEDPEIQSAYSTLAKNEEIDEDKAKEDYLAKRKADFAGLIIDADKVTFLDNFPKKDGKTIGEGTYKFSKTEEQMLGEHKITWNIFEATNEDAPYKYLTLMKIDPNEDLLHFHFRYGDDLDEILDKEDWFPTVVSPQTTNEQLIDEITE